MLEAVGAQPLTVSFEQLVAPPENVLAAVAAAVGRSVANAVPACVAVPTVDPEAMAACARLTQLHSMHSVDPGPREEPQVRGTRGLTWEDLPADGFTRALGDMAVRYGYCPA